MKIEVWDSLMGTGKTSGIIEWMLNNQQNRYIYVSPFLTEVEKRIPLACDGMGFVYPEVKDGNTKSDDLLILLRNGENIATTHKLFQLMKQEHLDAIRDREYILVIDECVDMIQSYDFNKGDLDNILDQGIIEIDYNHKGKLIPKAVLKNKSGSIASICSDAEKGRLYASKNSTTALVTQLPPELLQSAERTIILTYMFEGSLLSVFLKLHGMEYGKFTEGKLTRTEEEVFGVLKDKLKVLTTPSIKSLRDNNVKLSKSGYETATPGEMSQIRNAFRSVARKYANNDILITCFNDNVKDKTDRRWVGSSRFTPKFDQDKPMDNTFLSHTARATNDYKEKSVMVYGLEKHPHGTVSSYFGSYGFSVDRDKFALSEMLQWIWRGCIREDKEMEVYVLSEKMEKLLLDWLTGVSLGGESDLLEAA